MIYRAFTDEAPVVHSVKWIARVCSLCQFSLRMNLCSMTSVLILLCIQCLIVVVKCGLLGYDDALMIDVHCALLEVPFLLYACDGHSFNLEEYVME